MNDDIAISVEHVSKKFCRYLRKSMTYGIQDISRNFFRMSTKSDQLRKDEFWAVDDVSFELRRGETLGIIGPNGSGKSTMLKMLNGIFLPDKGRIETRGKMGALIEIGAGFHPMLTGRENIYVNGAILGMSKKELNKRFDDIVEFADIGDFLDTPVKNYSSGMLVRLGFAVAVHCEPDILLVDEVLAVGDVGFQLKCYNRIAELMKNCAVVFISHNMVMISRVCSKCLVLNNGHTIFQGTTEEAIQQYFSLFKNQETMVYSTSVRLVNCVIQAKEENGHYILDTDDHLEIDLELDSETNVEATTLRLAFSSPSGEYIGEWSSWYNKDSLSLHEGRQKFHISLYPLRLNPGIYYMYFVVTSENSLNYLLRIHRGWTLRIDGERIGAISYQIEGSISPYEGFK